MSFSNINLMQQIIISHSTTDLLHIKKSDYFVASYNPLTR